jgi:hypothetical protein
MRTQKALRFSLVCMIGLLSAQCLVGSEPWVSKAVARFGLENRNPWRPEKAYLTPFPSRPEVVQHGPEGSRPRRPRPPAGFGTPPRHRVRAKARDASGRQFLAPALAVHSHRLFS